MCFSINTTKGCVLAGRWGGGGGERLLLGIFRKNVFHTSVINQPQLGLYETQKSLTKWRLGRAIWHFTYKPLSDKKAVFGNREFQIERVALFLITAIELSCCSSTNISSSTSCPINNFRRHVHKQKQKTDMWTQQGRSSLIY